MRADNAIQPQLPQEVLLCRQALLADVALCSQDEVPPLINPGALTFLPLCLGILCPFLYYSHLLTTLKLAKV